jgi:hypothetical protein
VKRDDNTTWIAEEDASLRRRLRDLADEDPVDEAWDTIQRQIAARPPSRPPRRPIAAAAAAAAAVVVGALTLLPGHGDDSQVDTVGGKTTTSEPTSSSTTDFPTPTTTGVDDSTPSSPGTTSDEDDRPTTTTPGANGSRNRPSRPAPSPGTTAVDTTTDTTTGTTIPSFPRDWELTVTPTPAAPGQSVAVHSVTPCSPPEWATMTVVMVEVYDDGTRVDWTAFAITAPGTWTWFYDTQVTMPAGDYEVRATCEAERTGGTLEIVGVYAPQILTVTGS